MSKKAPQRMTARQAAAYAIPCALPILEMMRWPSFRAEVPWIRAHLRLSAKAADIRKALHVLVQAGLAERTRDGGLRPVAPTRATPTRAPAAVRTYHHTMLAECGRALSELDRRDRHVSSVTLRLSRKGYQRLCNTLDALRRQVLRGEAGGGASEVYYVGLQIVPLTQRQAKRQGSRGRT